MSDQDKANITNAELKALLEQNKQLIETVQSISQQQGLPEQQGNTMRASKKRHRTVTVMFIEGKPVVGMGNRGTEDAPTYLYEKPDPNDPKRSRLFADLIIKDVEKDELTTLRGIDFLSFVQQGERRDCKVVKSRNEEWIIEQGVTKRREVKEYRTVETDVEIPMEIEGTERYYIVDVGGKGVEIYESFVNMASSSPTPKKEIIKESETQG